MSRSGIVVLKLSYTRKTSKIKKSLPGPQNHQSKLIKMLFMAHCVTFVSTMNPVDPLHGSLESPWTTPYSLGGRGV